MAISANSKMGKTFLAYNQFGKNVVAKSKQNLARKKTRITKSGRRLTSRIDSSGDLSKSIRFGTQTGIAFFEMLQYGLYVDEGRKPGKYAPVDAIRKWVMNKPIAPRDERGRFKKRTPANMRSLAFLLNRAFYKHGIDPTYFFTEPFEQELKLLIRKLPDAIVEDIETYFTQ